MSKNDGPVEGEELGRPTTHSCTNVGRPTPFPVSTNQQLKLVFPKQTPGEFVVGIWAAGLTAGGSAVGAVGGGKVAGECCSGGAAAAAKASSVGAPRGFGKGNSACVAGGCAALSSSTGAAGRPGLVLGGSGVGSAVKGVGGFCGIEEGTSSGIG